jgi:transposase
MGKKGNKQKRYSAEFKIGVIIDMREHHMCYNEIVRKYWDINKGQEHNYRKQVQRWERIYLEEGAEGLMKERRGRPPKLDKTVEDDLIAENQRLRMEIEYLKKLNALVLKREQAEKKKH